MFRLLLMISSFITIPLSFLRNCAYWAWHIRALKKTIHEKRIIANNLRTVRDIIDLMHGFKWTRDTWFDWQPFLITILHRSLKDDCDGSAKLARWAFKCIGRDARTLSLWKKWSKSGHAICMTSDNEIMVSNSTVVHVIGEDWEKWVLDFFDNKYNIIASA